MTTVSMWAGVSGASAPGPAGSGTQRGFTLIEVMVVVVIVATLAVIAYPSYQNQMAKARRAEMEGELVRLAQFMERIYTESGCYNPNSGGTCGGTPEAPALSTTSRYYTVAFVANQLTNSTFVIQATPISGGPQGSDGFLRIDHLGRRYWDRNNDGSIGAGEDTWNR